MGGGEMRFPLCRGRHRPPSKASTASSNKGELFVHRPDYFPHTSTVGPVNPPPLPPHLFVFIHAEHDVCEVVELGCALQQRLALLVEEGGGVLQKERTAGSIQKG